MKATDYCKNVFDGTHDTPKPAMEGYKLLTSKNILDGRLDKEDAYYISAEDYAAVNMRSRVKQWDVLFSMIGTVGNVCLVTDENIDFAIKNMGDFSCEDEERAKWLYYYLQSPYAKKLMENYLNGAVQKFLPLGWLRELDIPEYDDVKKNVVNFLWDVDAKIANNNAICSNLEAMAKLLYDYWFVQFDFPDENGKPYKSSGGKMVWNEDLKREIPAGWTVSRLGNECEILLGGTPDTSKAEYWDGDIPWLNSGEVAFSPVLSAEKTITKKGMNNSATAFAEAGAVVMSITRYIRPSILGIDACFNQSVVAVKPTEIFHTSYLYLLMKSNVDRYMKLRTGAQQPHINKEIVENTMLICPSENVLNEYYQLVENLYAQQMNASKETQQLASLRDFLLPMLMNGQVKVC